MGYFKIQCAVVASNSSLEVLGFGPVLEINLFSDSLKYFTKVLHIMPPGIRVVNYLSGLILEFGLILMIY